MSRTARGIVALVLAVAFGAVPLAADWCAVSCETGASATSAGAPPCHHSGSTLTRISNASACGHDHRGIAVIASATSSTAPKSSIFALTTAAADPISTVRVVAMISRAGPRAPSAPPIPLALSAALRI